MPGMIYRIPVVAIPQSGFGAFELLLHFRGQDYPPRFQSFSRDSGRLNDSLGELMAGAIKGFNPSVGIRGV